MLVYLILLIQLQGSVVSTLFGLRDLSERSSSITGYNCYGCLYYGQFPMCLQQNPISCPSGTYCRIEYHHQGLVPPRLACSPQCQQTNISSSTCVLGGKDIGGHRCQVCCTDLACVHRWLDGAMTGPTRSTPTVQTNIRNSSQRVQCPLSCRANDISRCLTGRTHTCKANEICKLIRYGGVIEGYCSGNLPHCLQRKLNEPCIGPTAGHSNHCHLACCETQPCIQNSLSALSPSTTVSTSTMTSTSTATAAKTLAPTKRSTTAAATITTTNTTPTTQSTSTSSPNLYQRLKNNCKDQMQLGACLQLKSTQNLCHNPLAADLCPETCGLCQAIANTNCQDTVLNNGCQTLMVTRNICQDPLAAYTCPDTCGLCNTIVNQMLSNIIAGVATAPTSAASSSPTTMSMTTSTPAATTATTAKSTPAPTRAQISYVFVSSIP